MLKVRFIGRGMHLEFRHPRYPTPIVTSMIREISESQRTAADRPGRQVWAERFAGNESESSQDEAPRPHWKCGAESTAWYRLAISVRIKHW
jgi:hypothetical protein